MFRSRRDRAALRSRLLALCAALLAVLALTAPAGAEPQPVLSVSVGHGGAVRTHYFFPIHVEVSWVSPPGEPIIGDAQRAQVQVRVPQDMVYSQVITREITIQPGQKSAVVVYARTLEDFSELEATLRDDRGRVLARTRPSSAAIGGWWRIQDSDAIVIAVGKSTLPRSGWLFDHGSVSPVKVEELEAADLPREWPGYDGVTLVVLEDLQAHRLDAAQLATLLEWVQGGGRLAVTVTNQLETFRQVLGDMNCPVTFGSYEANPFDQTVGDVLRRAVARTMHPDEYGPTLTLDSGSPLAWYSQYLSTLINELASYGGRTFYGRQIALDESAQAKGWRIRDARLAFDPERAVPAESAPTSGHVAWGPLGLGEVTLLGVDPASLAGADANELRGVGWWHCLLHIAPLRSAVPVSLRESSGYYGDVQGSVNSAMSTTAVNEMLDTLSAPFGVSRGLFGAIAVALLLLVVLIGPVDFFLLRWIRREPLTWITCPLLVLLACGAIYLAQEAVSYGRARVCRATLIDAASGATRGVTTSLTAIFSNQGGRYALQGSEDGVYQTPASWNSPWGYYSGGNAGGTLVPIAQGSRGSLVESINVPLENVRWLMERGPASVPEMSALVHFDRARDRLFVDVSAPPGWEGRVAAVQWNEGWYVPSPASGTLLQGKLQRVEFKRDPGDEEAAKQRQRSSMAEPWGYYSNDLLSGWVHDASYQLPGHREIAQQIAGLGPSVAAVLIDFDHRSELELTRNGATVDAEWSEVIHVRLLAPAQRAAANEEPEP